LISRCFFRPPHPFRNPRFPLRPLLLTLENQGLFRS
jgi:hypothetical protein